jgi:hypothetical protein
MAEGFRGPTALPVKAGLLILTYFCPQEQKTGSCRGLAGRCAGNRGGPKPLAAEGAIGAGLQHAPMAT